MRDRDTERRIEEERARGEMLQRLDTEEETFRAEMRRRVEEEERIRLEVRRRLEAGPPAQPSAPPHVIVNNMFSSPQPQMVGALVVTRSALPLALRLAYFLLVGWWAGIAWSAVALALCVTIIGLPVGILMLAKARSVFFL